MGVPRAVCGVCGAHVERRGQSPRTTPTPTHRSRLAGQVQPCLCRHACASPHRHLCVVYTRVRIASPPPLARARVCVCATQLATAWYLAVVPGPDADGQPGQWVDGQDGAAAAPSDRCISKASQSSALHERAHTQSKRSPHFLSHFLRRHPCPCTIPSLPPCPRPPPPRKGQRPMVVVSPTSHTTQHVRWRCTCTTAGTM